MPIQRMRHWVPLHASVSAPHSPGNIIPFKTDSDARVGRKKGMQMTKTPTVKISMTSLKHIEAPCSSPQTASIRFDDWTGR
jgi:hypothetical protein